MTHRYGVREPTPPPSPRFPKTVPVFFRRAHGQLVHITLSLAHKSGSFRQILNALSGDQVNLLAVSISDGSHEGFAEGHIFAEVDPSLRRQDLEEILRKVPVVREVRVEVDIDGRMIDDSYPLRMSEAQRVLLFSQPAFTGALNEMRDALGSGGSVLLFEFGEHLGREIATEATRTFGTEFVLANLGYSMRLASAMGWGQAEVLHADVEKGRFAIRIHDSFECVRGPNAQGPRSQLVRGLLAGTFAGLTGFPIACTETACVAQGAAYCDFELERQSPKSPDAAVLPG